MAGRSFVGFGFGAIAAGLFLLEAQRSGSFSRLVIGYRRPEVIRAVRKAGGRVAVNVAGAERIERVTLGPVELLDVNDEGDRGALAAAIAGADELATALSGVGDYRNDTPGSVHRLLARGLALKLERGGPPLLAYAAENHHRAAELLRTAVEGELPTALRHRLAARLQIVDTVIGKMSGVVEDRAQIEEQALIPIAPGLQRAFLVESFDRILIERVRLPGFVPGIAAFEQRADLTPFEEAKLYGHNAAHALLAYLGRVAGLRAIHGARGHPELLAFVRAAFLEESGAALIARHHGADPLFTPAGFRAHVDDLLARMTNRLLNDTVERVGRDPLRKLGWNDRLIGTMRVALAHGIAPRRFALGAAAALEAAGAGDGERGRALLAGAWADAAAADERERVLALIDEARPELARWRPSSPERSST